MKTLSARATDPPSAAFPGRLSLPLQDTAKRQSHNHGVLCARRNSRCAQPSYRRNGRLVGISWPDLRRHEAASSAVSLVGHNIDARTFYRWLKNNLEFRHRYEEAIAIRERLIPERLWELSFEVTDKNCRSRKTQAQLLEKAIAHIDGGPSALA